MHCEKSARGASGPALVAVLVSFELLHGGKAVAQHALPTIEVGGARRASSARGPVTRNVSRAPTVAQAAQTVAPTAAPSPSPVAPASALRLEPKTPAEAYIIKRADSTTKTNIPIRELPVSIQVVPKQALVDQQVTNIKDGLSNVSDVVSNNLEGVGAIFYIRGFQTNYIYRNGLALPQGEASPTLIDTANVERVEVMKGPSSILFGRAEPGGIINIVTKQPLDQPLYKIEQQIGSYDHYRTQWDISQPVQDVPGLAFRFSGAYQTNGSFRQFQGGRRALIAPVIRYAPTASTELTIDTQFLTSRIQNDIGQPYASLYWPLLQPLPNWRSYQEANDPKDVNDTYTLSYNFRQNLNEDWKITNRFAYTEARWSSNQLAGAGVDANLLTNNRIAQFQDLKGYNYATNIDLTGKFDALLAKHNFLFGLDYLNSYFDYYYANGTDNYPINLYNPIYGTVPQFAFWDSILGTGFKQHTSNLSRQKGMYVQDHATWDRLHLMVGVRYDIADTTRGSMVSIYNDTLDPAYILAPSKAGAIADRLAQPSANFTGWSPRAGVLFDVTPELGAYVSYSRSFGKPNNGFDTSGRPFPPEKGLQYEAGVKYQPLPGLLATLSVFQITKSNVTTIAFGSVQAQQFAGLQRSRGVELDVVGAITDRMSIIANYAYLNAKVIADSPMNWLNPYGLLPAEPFPDAVVGPEGGFMGNHLPFAPRNTGKVFLTYDFTENQEGFRVGGGLTASTHWWGDIQNVIIMPGYARLDGFASYTAKIDDHKVTAQLNLNNINNVKYFEAVDNQFNFFAPPFYRIPARPFEAVGTIRFHW